MDTLDRLQALLPGDVGKRLELWRGDVREIRLRADRPAQLISGKGEWLSPAPLDAGALNRILASLMDFSLYAREEELRQGFFTTADGCRVGVCGRLVADDGRVVALSAIGSVCVRVSRQVSGCAEDVLPAMLDGRGGVRSTLILSPPGLGKTTLLREIARRLSCEGLNVCVADERHELAACRDGVPTLDVGPRTDVMDGGPKAVAIRHMLRASAPRVIVADEIGGPGDAEALAEAARCGVSVVTSAHAADFDALARRPALRAVAETGVFALGVLLGSLPGAVAEMRTYRTGEGWHALGAGDLRGGRVPAGGLGHGRGLSAAGDGAVRADRGTLRTADPHDAHA